MTPEAFKNSWTKNGDELSPISPKRLERFQFGSSTREFLILSGLPIQAAPFLSFVQDNDDIVYDINKITYKFDFREPEYEKYVMIGSCGNGDPVAINTDNNDQIEWLNHEDYFSSLFFNSTINALAECLLAYREFVSAVQKENGEDAFLNSDFTDAQFEVLKQSIDKADSRALTEDGFWKEELDTLLMYREDARKQQTNN